jgi:hypothetical protein
MRAARTTIVTGLPRSGTSLMMQMLHAGGVECATDGVRAADADNPRGYFEVERVKLLAGGDPASVVASLRGRAVKIIHWLLFRLPAPFEADVIVVQRDPREVVASQMVMLERRGRRETLVDEDRLVALYERETGLLHAWLARRPDLRALTVVHADVVSAPRAQAQRIARFLERDLDVQAMAETVEPSLYRQRSAKLARSA